MRRTRKRRRKKKAGEEKTEELKGGVGLGDWGIRGGGKIDCWGVREMVIGREVWIVGEDVGKRLSSNGVNYPDVCKVLRVSA